MPNMSESLNNTALRSNLHYLMKVHNLTALKLANGIGVSVESIHKLRGGGLKNPTLKMLLGLTRFFNISVENLVYDNLAEKMQSSPHNLKIKYLPVIDWIDLATWKTANPKGYIISDRFSSESCFVLEIKNTQGEFALGSKIIIDTEKQPVTDNYVLIFNKKESLFHIKRFIVDDRSYLESIILGVNSTTTYIESEHMIYGVIVGYQKNF